MAALQLFFLLITQICISNAQQNRNSINISVGSSLSPSTNKSFWLSNSGQFAFGFYQYGNGFALGIWFEKIQQKTVIWTANRDDQPLSNDVTLILNRDGLVLQQKQGLQVPITGVSLPAAAASASMLDSGNFALYHSNSTIIWQSFDHPTDTILPGQHVMSGHSLVSGVSSMNHSSGRFQLIMQLDGNLKQYPLGITISPYYGYWSSGTQDKSKNSSLNLDENGQLYLLNSNGSIMKTIFDGQSQSQQFNNFAYRFTIDVDGILRLYSHNLVQNSSWVAEWISTRNKCDPVGLCGLNSYCTVNNISQETDCSCLPGFDFIDHNQKSFGCQRNSGIDSCKSDHEKAFRVAEFDVLEWENNSYSVVYYMNKTECQEDCLRDCNCMVALFENQHCSKQMVPLRFAKPHTSALIKTIVKVPNNGGGDYGTNSNMPLKKGHKRKNITVFVLVCIIIALTILLFSLFFLYRKQFKSYKNVPNEKTLIVHDILALRSFSLRELEISTSGFIHKLGRGSFGTVFKGTINLPNGERAIAVKRLEKVVAAEGEIEFQNEMKTIGRTHHRNLLRLLGYCHEGSNRLLVYDYMSNGSLANFLFKSEIKPNWKERVSMAFGIAKGILYLHEECENQIIHCDINPNNILIDENRVVKIADFGLAKLLMPDQTRTTTGIKGTRGFVAPEWHKNMPITSKAEVYSFGVVLLVIISCRPHVDVNVHEREAILVDFTYECVKANQVRNLVQLNDDDDEDVEEEELVRMVKIGLWCIEEEPTIRPAMKKVVAMFEGTVDIPLPPGVASYNSANSSNNIGGVTM
ncbi:hypothetical protein G4B88_027650 [Cannabis sativa]|uniref:Receptor-like serine/threonine-protein kinase n=1 Tax=Cannabis sativa TaxID=3483 RepID=A0A7J6G1Z1_CANSA|nr:hypothetical protein G4B88_027650 [Cannabis sativa]